MNKLFKTTLLLAAIFAFSSCSKSGDRPVEAGTNGDKTGALAVVTKKEINCTYVVVTSEVVEGKTVRTESATASSKTSTKSTKDKGVNSAIDEIGKYSNVMNTLNADGTKTKTNEMKYSFVKKLTRFFEARPANVFYQKDDYVINKTADEGFFFNGPNGTKVTTKESKAVTEFEYFDDGVMTKDISYKVDGKLQPPAPYEYSTVDSKEGAYDVNVLSLKAPYTEEGVTTESDVTTCKNKIIN